MDLTGGSSCSGGDCTANGSICCEERQHGREAYALLHTIAGHDTCMLGEGDGVALHHFGTVLILAGDLDDDVLLGVILMQAAKRPCP